MKENLPIVVNENSIWNRIKKFFFRLWDNMFEKEDASNIDQDILNDTISQMNEDKEVFENSLKADIDLSVNIKKESAVDKRESYLDSLAGDVDVLANMSIEELNEIEGKLDRTIVYYKCKVAEKDSKLKTERLKFLDSLEEQPKDIIESSMARLKKIEEYYDSLIAEIDAKIAANQAS